MHLLDNYSSIIIGKEYEGDDTAHEDPATAEPHFFLIAYYDIKKLKVDELHIEFNSRSHTTGGLKKDLKLRLEKSMVNKFSIASSISE